MKYESASHMLRKTRIEAAQTEIHKAILLEMDQGNMLPGLKKAEEALLRYKNEESDLLSAVIFETENGKILFSVQPTQIGQKVPETWRKKCVRPDTFFTDEEKEEETVGLPILNALSENTGCLAATYATKSIRNIREEMIKTAFRYAFRSSVIGVFICFSLYFFTFLITNVFQSKKIQSTVVFILCQILLLTAMFLNFSAMFRTFEADLKPEIETKSRLLAGQISRQLGRMVQNGVPFDSVTALEAYMDQIRQENKEILFVLVTDKTGRVLYESGSASQAFKADARTGKIFLRDGYYNAAEPVTGAHAAIGWVQIGVNERFVREKVF